MCVSESMCVCVWVTAFKCWGKFAAIAVKVECHINYIFVILYFANEKNTSIINSVCYCFCCYSCCYCCACWNCFYATLSFVDFGLAFLFDMSSLRLNAGCVCISVGM